MIKNFSNSNFIVPRSRTSTSSTLITKTRRRMQVFGSHIKLTWIHRRAFILLVEILPASNQKWLSAGETLPHRARPSEAEQTRRTLKEARRLPWCVDHLIGLLLTWRRPVVFDENRHRHRPQRWEGHHHPHLHFLQTRGSPTMGAECPPLPCLLGVIRFRFLHGPGHDLQQPLRHPIVSEPLVLSTVRSLQICIAALLSSLLLTDHEQISSILSIFLSSPLAISTIRASIFNL